MTPRPQTTASLGSRAMQNSSLHSSAPISMDIPCQFGSFSLEHRLSSLLFPDTLDLLRRELTSFASGVLLVGGDVISRQSLCALCTDVRKTSVRSCLPTSSTGIFSLNLSSSILNCPEATIVVHDVQEACAASSIRALFDRPVRPRILAEASSARSVHISLRRAGRFDIVLSLPHARFAEREAAWKLIVEVYFQEHIMHLTLEEHKECYVQELSKRLAEVSPGFGVSDILHAISSFRRQESMRELRQEHSTDIFQEGDIAERFVEHVEDTRPSAGISDTSDTLSFARIGPDDDNSTRLCVGGYKTQRAELRALAEWPILRAKEFARLRVRAPRGVLLHGARGTGKTLLAKELLRELKCANCISVNAPDIFSMYLGETERRIRELFERARMLEPCVLFIDEIDAIGADRATAEDDGPGGGGTGVERRVLGALLAELDGAGDAADEEAKVFVVACTAEPNAIDPALIRPGRIDHLIELPIPELEERMEILDIVTKGLGIEDENKKKTVLKRIAERTQGFTGADFSALCRKAALLAMEDEHSLESTGTRNVLTISEKHLMRACSSKADDKP